MPVTSEAGVFEKEAFRLRPLVEDDAEALATFSEDERYWRFLSHGPRTLKDIRVFLASALAPPTDPARREVWWAVEDAETKRVIGTANLRIDESSDKRRGSAGCTLAPDMQGRGLGPILGGFMFEVAFDVFDFAEIECTCAEDNARSVHLMRDTYSMTYHGVRETQRDSSPEPWRVHVFTMTRDQFLALSL